MAIPTFVQKSRINQVIYQIRGSRLLISERALLGKFVDRELDLRWLNPDYHPGLSRNYTTLVVLLLLAALCGLVTWGAFRQTLLPQEAAFYIAHWPAIGFVVFLGAAVRWSRRIEYYLFNNRAGRPAVVFIREREQAEECAAFIATLVAHIELTQADLSEADRLALLKSTGADRAFIPAPASKPALWKISIVLGLLAAGLPWIPNLGSYLPLFLIVFSLCSGAAICCAFSFITNESMRWWSVPGLLLALIPPFFYL